jgi:RNA 2',3'-cyclic 3'-phosphodiesterase
MPRLFVSLDLPDWVRESLAEIAGGLPGASWLPPEQLHLTLRFIGEVENRVFQEVRESLGSIQSRSFYLSLQGVGHFPLRGDPETLWAGVSKSDELLRLRHKIENQLVRYGLEPDTRKFFPHVTLARIKEARALWVGEYLAVNSLFAVAEIPVQGFALYSSLLTPDGAIHRLEGSYPLEGLLEGERE